MLKEIAVAIVDGELFSVEQEDGPFMTVFGASGNLRVIVGTTAEDDKIVTINLDELNVGRLRRAIDVWFAGQRA